jgi:hypothetical protein
VNSREKAAQDAGKLDVKVRAGITWSGAYNIYHASLYGWIDLQTAWEGGDGPANYSATIGGKKLNQRFHSHEEAAEGLVTFLRQSFKKMETLP